MHTDIHAHFAELEEAIESTAVPKDRKEVIGNFIKRLPGLYTKYCQTTESRYFVEITGIVQAVLKDLEACPEAQKLDAAFREKLRLLHEEVGLGKLPLKSAPPPPKPKKTPKKK